MSNTSYIGLEITPSLLTSYEILALKYKARYRMEKNDAESNNRDVNQYVNYDGIFSLLLINASIIEGALRALISQKVLQDIEQAVNDGRSRGQTEPSKPEELLSKFHSDIEMQGGWGKTKEQYMFYFDLSLNELMTKTDGDSEDNNPLKDSINVLFTLRNILAHGTAIIQPKVKMDDELKDLYPFNWQRKLQQTSVYLKKQFGNDDVLENLTVYELPEHFLNKTKELFEKIESEFGDISGRPEKIFSMMKEYSFGYLYFSR
jgi:hypothetical protein